ncbi:MAG: peptidoglycan DD-metalloendopeptidase family protein [Oscillospiraceae bacterium]|nr:peptidoglycan DD-metalloendopeptidase family protein [Oscillospiraceae bacterium]
MKVLRAVGKLCLWIIMVAVMTALLVGGVLAFLYSRAGQEDLPADPVTFEGQTLENVGYDWAVPILGGVIEREFQLSPGLALQELGTFDHAGPVLALPGWGTRAELTIENEAGEVVFHGSGEEYAEFRFGANGRYMADIRVWHESPGEKPAKPQGWYAYRVRFGVDAQPKLTISDDYAYQGQVLALRVTGVLGSEAPQAQCDLGPVWFALGDKGWTGYLPVTYNAEQGNHDLTVTSGSHTLEAVVTVVGASFADQKTIEAEGYTAAAAREYQNKVWPLYQEGDLAPQWWGRFTQPAQGDNVQKYGAYLAGGARSTEYRIQAEPGSEVVSPTDGVVLFAGYLELGGNTVIIHHGCGLKSYLSGLGAIGVAEGQQVLQGQQVAEAAEGPVVLEMRIGNKSIDPAYAFSGRSGLFYR